MVEDMKNFAVYTVLVMSMLSVIPSVVAQDATPLPFVDDFESADGNAEWHLRTRVVIDRRLKNRWVVSGSESFSGDSCLLISDNDTLSAAYNNTVQNTAVAYREFYLEPGEYDLSVAWRGMGDKKNDCMYVCWAPVSTTVNITASIAGIGDMPVEKYACAMGESNRNYLSGQADWTVSRVKVRVENKAGNDPVAYRLYLVWDNDNKRGNNPSACVDYVQLSKASCESPAGVGCEFDEGELVLSWSGSASEYEVRYRKSGEKEMGYAGKTSERSMTLGYAEEGLYDFSIRPICGSDTGIWVEVNRMFAYNPMQHCLNYLSLTDPNVECTYGDFLNPYKYKGRPVDNGRVKSSIHTRYDVKGETDPRTGGRLKTIPDDEIASIRLSNWTEGTDDQKVKSPSGSISCKFTVKDETPILLVRYAAVLQYSTNHTEASEQTQISVRVFGEDGKLVEDCAEIEFNALDVNDNKTRGWETYNPLTEGSVERDSIVHRECEIKWLDWGLPLGINLSGHEGEEVKVQITLKACAQDYHFAYTYFTLNCSSGEMQGYSCGEEEQYTAIAPEGFDYEWYRKSDPSESVMHRERVLTVPASDVDTFVCNLVHREKRDCKFPLYAYLVPKVPEASFTYEHAPHDCKNRIRLSNASGVMVNDALSTSEVCDYTEWRIENLSTGEVTTIDSLNPEYMMDNAGGRLRVSLITGISTCRDTAEMEITVPAIGDYRDTVEVNACRLPYKYKGEGYGEGEHILGSQSKSGCDTVITLRVWYTPAMDTTIYDTICSGVEYEFVNGVKFTTGSPAEGYVGTVKSSSGCDSVITLHLEVIPEVEVRFEVPGEVCADDSGFTVTYDMTAGVPTAYSMKFDEAARAAGFADVEEARLEEGSMYVAMPEGVVRPDRYAVSVLLHTPGCEVYEERLDFTVLYPVRGIMEQKWNDVVALLNSHHNCGEYEYARHQWYRNGDAIPGATASYLYIGEGGVRFDTGDEYRVMLTRVGESEGIMSCAMKPEVRPEGGSITLRQPQGAGRVYVEPVPTVECVGRWYTSTGVYCGEERVSEADGSIAKPVIPGVYVLHLISESERCAIKVVVE